MVNEFLGEAPPKCCAKNVKICDVEEAPARFAHKRFFKVMLTVMLAGAWELVVLFPTPASSRLHIKPATLLLGCL
jgi:hypothetical protein